jgi:hypothetical protein
MYVIICNMAKKKMTKPATSDTSGMSLADFKAKYSSPAPASSASVGIAGKTYKAPGTGKAYVGPASGSGTPVKTAGKGFAGSGTPLGSSIAGSNLSKGNVASAALLVTALPAKAGSVVAIGGGKIVSKVLGRYAVPSVQGAAQGAFTSATKGLEAISGGGRIYKANTVFGPTLASTKIASSAQTAGRLTGLEANAARIATDSARGAAAGGINILKDIQTGKKIVKGAAALGGLYAIKKK